MTDNDENIDVEVLELTDLAPEGDVVVEAEKPKIETAEDGIESLREQLDRERQARMAAEQQMQEYAKTAYSAQNEVQDSNMHLVNNAIETVRQQQEILKENLRRQWPTMILTPWSSTRRHCRIVLPSSCNLSRAVRRCKRHLGCKSRASPSTIP